MTRWFADPASLADWGGPAVRFPLSAGQLDEWIAEAANERSRLCFTVSDEGDRPIGHVQLLRDLEANSVRLGRFGIAPERRGQGFGRALFEMAVRMAFVDLDAERVVLAVAIRNERARRLYASCGFREEGSVLKSRTPDGAGYSVQMMGLARRDWKAFSRERSCATRVA